MRLGIDNDGTISDFHGKLAEIFEIEFGLGMKPNPCKWEMWGCWGIRKQRFFQLFTRAVEEFGVFEQSEPIPGAIEGLMKLKASGHSLHLVTDRGAFPSAPSQTVNWLRKHGLFGSIDAITFTRDKSSVNIDVLVDDYTGNCDNLASGVGHILIDRPWNRQRTGTYHVCNGSGWDVPINDKYNRAFNWKEIVDMIEGDHGA